jgi:glycosyltransferase involved in cell wall biosynthesis
MRVLLAHNYYQIRGGEDVVFEEEANLLEQHGHDVARFIRNNRDIDGSNIKLALNTIWSKQSARDIAAAVREHQADIVHFHNLFPIISPSAYSAAKKAGATVVKTIHNFRDFCAKAVFFRDGKQCYDCMHSRLKLPAIIYACYRDNRAATAVSVASAITHRSIGTLAKSVDALIVPSQFAKDQYEAAGYPTCPIYVKPHFVERDLGVGSGQGRFAMYVGRLSEEKGIRTLLAAAAKAPEVPLKIVGDGPLVSLMDSLPSHVTWLGKRTSEEVYQLMGDATFLVLPSSCEETFGRVIIEAFARGTPVICSAHGGQKEVVKRHLGRQFAPNDAEGLANAMREMFGDENQLQSYRQSTRAEYLENYQASRNHELLIAIYRQAQENRQESLRR